jgi:hypothetical protein
MAMDGLETSQEDLSSHLHTMDTVLLKGEATKLTTVSL